MRRLTLTLLLALTGLLSLAPGRAGAVGIGLYGGAGRGDASDWWGEDLDTGHQEVGFVLDTSLAGRSAFHYRLQIGHDRFTADAHGPWDERSDATLEGLVLDHSFGFRLFQHEAVRLWLGPQVRVARYRGHGSYPDDLGGEERTDIELSAFGGGPVAGVDANLPGGLTLALSGGWRVMFYSGDEEAQNDEGTDGGDFESFAEELWFLDLAVLWRFGE